MLEKDLYGNYRMASKADVRSACMKRLRLRAQSVLVSLSGENGRCVEIPRQSQRLDGEWLEE